MVNKNELEVVKKYEKEGWKTLRGGAPDFIFVKVDNGKIKDFIFVEAKTLSDKLSYEQTIYRKILESLGAKYKVELIQPSQPIPCHTDPFRADPGQPRPNHATPSQPIPVHSKRG